jgi:hypothetical protein
MTISSSTPEAGGEPRVALTPETVRNPSQPIMGTKCEGRGRHKAETAQNDARSLSQCENIFMSLTDIKAGFC